MTQAAQSTRMVLAGGLLFAMIVLVICNGIWPSVPLLPGAIAAWIAGVLLFNELSFGQRVQVGIIAGVGLALMLIGAWHGAAVSVREAFQANCRLLTMIAAVGFLRLVAIPRQRVTRAPPVGPWAYARTLLAIATLGSVINVSAPLLVADRLASGNTLSRLASQSITRVFSGCSAWSPFFGGMATVITYVDEASLLVLMIGGLPFAVIGLLLVMGEARWRYGHELANFAGYPMTLSSLRVPIILALSVLALYQISAGLSILLVIAIAALCVTLALLVINHGVRGASQQFVAHIRSTLSRMGGELSLFLAAGLLASGLAALVDAGWISITLNVFNATSASLLLGGMLLLSAAGIHPVILIAGLTPLLMKLSPQPELLALTYLIAWSIGTCASPLSGTHLIFQGRYGIPSWKAAIWNWPFALVMYAVGVGLLHLTTTIMQSQM